MLSPIANLKDLKHELRVLNNIPALTHAVTVALLVIEQNDTPTRYRKAVSHVRGYFTDMLTEKPVISTAGIPELTQMLDRTRNFVTDSSIRKATERVRVANSSVSMMEAYGRTPSPDDPYRG